MGFRSEHDQIHSGCSTAMFSLPDGIVIPCYTQKKMYCSRKMMIQPSNFGIYPMFRQTKLVSLKFLQYPPQVYAHIPR